jgi:hypothetical protein
LAIIISVRRRFTASDYPFWYLQTYKMDLIGHPLLCRIIQYIDN